MRQKPGVRRSIAALSFQNSQSSHGLTDEKQITGLLGEKCQGPAREEEESYPTGENWERLLGARASHDGE